MQNPSGILQVPVPVEPNAQLLFTMLACSNRKGDVQRASVMLVTLFQRRDSVVLVQLAAVPRIANAIPIIIDDPAIF